MIFLFDAFELDTDRLELRGPDGAVALEPQVFGLIRLLIERRDHVVTKDDIIEAIWGGRIVSDSALSSRVKSARQALGDDGRTQRLIRTHHGVGFRFVADVAVEEARSASRVSSSQAVAPNPDPAATALHAGRPSIAVLPFRRIDAAESHEAFADALPHDLIAELSRLRWLFVIARGSSFRFRAPDADIRQIGTALGVRYCLSGAVEIKGARLEVAVELADTRDSGVIWAERFNAAIDDIHTIRTRIVADIVAALELRIPDNEARAAGLATPGALDAWSIYHLGVQQMYLFRPEANARAAQLFARATQIEPGFARAHAGLSFTSFQDAFLRYTNRHDDAVAAARRHAERAAELDPMDPFSNYTMGRALWLEADLEGGLNWLERATQLNPNFAQGIYARAVLGTLAGRGDEACRHIDTAMMLSPLDPLLYAMKATRALACIVRGETAEAAVWAETAARSPGAHIHIEAIAMIAHTLNDDTDRAAYWAGRVRAAAVTGEDFLRAFPMENPAARALIAGAFSRHNF